jgi:dihydrofolate synthase/folylpolyglutamate synthase
MNFAETLSYLLSLGHETLAIKLGLRNTELLLAALGNPHQAYEAVQIAGTNGKGSTAALLASICRQAGIATGLYTSPHLVSITERIVINGNQISAAQFAQFASEVRAAADSLLAQEKIAALPTFFEHVTAIALLAFRAAGVKLAILETGLGGRLDATTVAGANIVGLTPIALDHEEYLGETLAEIAAEKAAIIRPGVDAISAPQLPAVAEVIRKRSSETGVAVHFAACHVRESRNAPAGKFEVTFETNQDRYDRVCLGLRGRHQITNACVAIQLAESLCRRGFAISKEAIVSGLETAEHAGRLSFYPGKPSVLLDGAHNPSAAHVLRAYLDEFVTTPVTLIFGAMRDKRLAEMAATLFPRVANLVLTHPDNPRAAPVETLQALAAEFVAPGKIFAEPDVPMALRRARELTPPAGLICATGSLFLIGELTAMLQTKLVKEPS